MQNIVAFRLRQSRRSPGFSATSAALLAISAVKAPVTGETQLASLLRGEIANIVAGAFFLFICVIALSIATIRPGKSTRLMVWLGVWSGMYGAQESLRSGSVVAAG